MRAIHGLPDALSRKFDDAAAVVAWALDVFRRTHQLTDLLIRSEEAVEGKQLKVECRMLNVPAERSIQRSTPPGLEASLSR